MKRIDLNEETILKIKELFDNQEPVKKIAKQVGSTEKLVYRTIKERNWTRDKSVLRKRNFYDASKDELIISMYSEGKSTVEIGKEVGLSHIAVIKHLKKNNINRRSLSDSQLVKNNKTYPEELKSFDIMDNLYNVEKLTKKDLSKKFNVSPGVIDKSLRSLNIEIRDRKSTKNVLKDKKND